MIVGIDEFLAVGGRSTPTISAVLRPVKYKRKEACIALCYMKLHLVALRHGPCLTGSHGVTCHPHVLCS